MKDGVLAFIGGIAAALGVAALRTRKLRRIARRLTTLDLNKAAAEDFVALGLDPLMADRIIEYRPYRSRIELLERYVLGKVDFDLIRDRVGIDVAHAHDAVNVAS